GPPAFALRQQKSPFVEPPPTSITPAVPSARSLFALLVLAARLPPPRPGPLLALSSCFRDLDLHQPSRGRVWFLRRCSDHRSALRAAPCVCVATSGIGWKKSSSPPESV